MLMEACTRATVGVIRYLLEDCENSACTLWREGNVRGMERMGRVLLSLL